MAVVTERGWPVVLVFGPLRLRAGGFLAGGNGLPRLYERLARERSRTKWDALRAGS